MKAGLRKEHLVRDLRAVEGVNQTVSSGPRQREQKMSRLSKLEMEFLGRKNTGPSLECGQENQQSQCGDSQSGPHIRVT